MISIKALSCLFVRTDGVGERYAGDIKRFVIDIGYTKDAEIVWLVFSPGTIAAGASTGNYVDVAAQATVGLNVAAARCRCPAAVALRACSEGEW